METRLLVDDGALARARWLLAELRAIAVAHPAVAVAVADTLGEPDRPDHTYDDLDHLAGCLDGGPQGWTTPARIWCGVYFDVAVRARPDINRPPPAGDDDDLVAGFDYPLVVEVTR